MRHGIPSRQGKTRLAAKAMLSVALVTMIAAGQFRAGTHLRSFDNDMAIRNRFAELLPEITEWRRDFHRHPELLFEVHRTAGIVAQKLRDFGCDEVETGIGRTGVVGLIHGKRGKGGRTIGLRADMDALPIEERTGAEHASTNPGVMHACGHDGHTAMLLGAAQYLCETRNFEGSVAVIFQPAEEGGGGGREMVADGIMDRFGIEEVYGMHNWPGVKTGAFGIRSGPFFAAADLIEITVSGKGGHAAKPHKTHDPVLATAHIVTALQSIASRNLDPIKQLVVSVTSMQTSSTAFNVIPSSVRLTGTVRSLDEDVRDMAEQRIEEIATGVASAFGCEAEVTYDRNYPVMTNAARNTEYAAEAARRVAGDCFEADLVMGGEDFAFLLNARPGAYILVGNGDTANVHHPEYDFNDDAIPAGCSWLVEMAESRLAGAE
jgi:hippurate hydrolase